MHVLFKLFVHFPIQEQKGNKTQEGKLPRKGESNGKSENPSSRHTEKKPYEWVTGEEPMTGAQASYLKTLSEQKHQPRAFDDDLTKAEASKRIDKLKGS